MLLDCKYCNTKFDVKAEEVGLDGRLIKCENCQKEWFQESKSQYLEKKLIELDQNLHATEVHLIEQKNIHKDKITKLENSLKVKKEELAKQKLLEERIALYEKRITSTEKEIAEQALVENSIIQLEKEIKKDSFDSFVKNTDLEKKINYLQMKIHSEGINDRLDNLENNISDAEKLNSIEKIKIKQNFKKDQTKNVEEVKKKKVIDTEKSNKFFFWKKNNNNTVPIKKNLYSSPYTNTHPDTWDLSEKAIELELRELRKTKKNS